jgi:nitrite reductase (NADH) small subunit/3-phenylpropionate/trans-cinnamate dioxygenase ferredoxin subunit
MAFVRAARKEDIPLGKIYEFQVAGQAIAIANVAGKFCAIKSVCAHEGGPLGEGELDGQVVTCPWHAWQYYVTTGKMVQNPAVGVDCYPVEVQGDDVFVDVK